MDRERVFSKETESQIDKTLAMGDRLVRNCSKTIDFVFAEFNSKFPVPYANVRFFFPEASFIEMNQTGVKGPFDPNHPRYGWRMNDYWQMRGLLESPADIAIALDADMQIVSHDVRTIIPLVKKFGLCLTVNPRNLVRVDTLVGADSDQKLDETNGTGYALNSALIAFDTSNARARELLKEAASQMEINPVRAPLAYWRAIYKTGFFPCLLPPQWCVCGGDEGIGNEIILHIGHESIRNHYGVTL